MLSSAPPSKYSLFPYYAGRPHAHVDRAWMVRGLKKTATSDELDAATAALTGRWFLLGQGLMLGGDSGILIPAVDGLKVRARMARPQ
jgi:hypothetical protein